MRPELSIIMPVYNSSAFLEKTIASIQAQTFRKYELILINDGSTDGSDILCEEFAAKDNRIRVIHKENGGVASARNVGLDNAKGEYIGWVDSDDLISPVMYEILMDAARQYGADIVQCENRRNWDDLVLEKPTVMPVPEVTDGLGSLRRIHGKRYTNHMVLWSKIYRRELFEGIRFTPGQVFEDDERTPKLLYNGKVNVFFDLPLYRYTYRENSIAVGQKPKDAITLLGHLEDRMHWFHTLDEELYRDARSFYFNWLKIRLCQKDLRDTPVYPYAVSKLKQYRKVFWPIAHRYDRIALLLLFCGKQARSWVADNDFAPVQNIVAKIKRLNK